MPRDYLLYPEDILDASKRIEDYVSGVDFEGFVADNMRVDAVLHNFTILGEAVRSVPPVFVTCTRPLSGRGSYGFATL